MKKGLEPLVTEQNEISAQEVRSRTAEGAIQYSSVKGFSLSLPQRLFTKTFALFIKRRNAQLLLLLGRGRGRGGKAGLPLGGLPAACRGL